MSNLSLSQNEIVGKERKCNPQAIQNTFADFVETPTWVYNDAKNDPPKCPLNPETGNSASSTNNATWGTFKDVNKRVNNRPMDCLPAICLHDSLNLVCIDLDHVRDPETGDILPHAQGIVNKIQSATEISQSGTGLHIFLRGKHPGTHHKCTMQDGGDIEIYGTNHFITMTGNYLPGLSKVEERQSELNDVYNQYLHEKSVAGRNYQNSPHMSDEEVLTHCKNAKNNTKFIALYEQGITTEHNGDASAADIALVSILCFYTQEPDQIDRLFRTSKLYRDKWERADYRERTISTALSRLTVTYQLHDTTLRHTWNNPSTIDDEEGLDQKFPLEDLPSVLKEAVKEISRAFQVDPALVSLPGLAMAALQIGKKAFVCEKPGLLHHPALFFVGVAMSGERKSSVYKALLDGVIEQIYLEDPDHRKQVILIKTHNTLIDEQIIALKAKVRTATSHDIIATAQEKITILELNRKELPPNPKNWGDDITPERLFQKLHEHKGAYGVLSSDGRAIINRILGKGSKDGSSTESIYINGMWGDDIDRSRVGNNKGTMGGEDLTIQKPALTTCTFIQPDKWKEISKHPVMRDSGMISRVSVVEAESRIGTRIESETDEPLQQSKIIPYNTAISRIRRWQANGVIITLDTEATALRRAFFNDIEIQLGAGGRFEDVKDIATKATSLTARIALIFAILELANKDDLPEQIPAITGEQWVAAQTLEEYFLSQAIDSQRTHNAKGQTHLLHKIGRWLSNKAKEHSKNASEKEPLFVLASEISKGIRGTNTDGISQLIPKCLDLGWLRAGPPARKNIPRYEINLNLCKDTASRDTLTGTRHGATVFTTE